MSGDEASKPETPSGNAASLECFGPATRHWFTANFAAPTRVQHEGWPRIASGAHSLLLAPTGSGKTLAAFLAALDRCSQLDPEAEPGCRVLYISPLKALVYDIERNLRAPLAGMRNASEELGLDLRALEVDVRTGDTPQRDRARQRRKPADILVTTPESLFLLLGSQARETLRSVDTIILDEIHSLAPTKRGVHLALSLERMSRLCERDPQRIGLSATARPVDRIARYLGGNRDVQIVDASAPPALTMEIVVPVDDMTDVPRGRSRTSGSVLRDGLRDEKRREKNDREAGLMPKIWPALLEKIRASRASIVFVNSRGLCERMASKINELAEEELVLAHHGSVSHDKRRQIEDGLKSGKIRGIIATSSLELGIDMGHVDTVCLVESPGSVARGLQRVGRAGHGVGETSHGVLFPKFPGDLLESTVVAMRMLDGAIEGIHVPSNALDVLAQQIVAIVADAPITVEELEVLVKSTAPYAELSSALLSSVLDMLSGRYPSDDFAELRPRIAWDRATGELRPRRGAAMLTRLNAGTIPDRGLFAVHLGVDGPRIGELDEEMTYESRAGDVILLGASSWRILEITRDRVVVEPAPGEPGRLPFWHGDGPGRPLELGRAIGAFLRTVQKLDRAAMRDWLRENTTLDRKAALNLATYIDEQRSTAGALPTDERITIESFRDELGDMRVCILTPFGSRVHAPWAMALQTELSHASGFEVATLWSDDGIVLTFPDGEELPDFDRLLLDPERLEEAVTEQLSRSALFGANFRENAARALLLPKRSPRSRTPLWAQRLRAKNLLGTVRRYPDFPIVLETYRHCLQDVFDLPALEDILHKLRRREIGVDVVETRSASPFARSLVFAWVAAYLYEQDAPLAERRAQALTLDRRLLSELLGQDQLADLIEADVLARVEAELQFLTEDRQARDADELHDVLRRLGALDADAVAERCAGDGAEPDAFLAELEEQRRALRIRIAGRECWIAAQDAGLYRDGLGCSPPPGLPDAFLAHVEGAFELLVKRAARTHGPFQAETIATALRVPPTRIAGVLEELEADGTLMRGEFRPATGLEYCDIEVFRRIKRESLAKIRGEVAAVSSSALGRFLPQWQGIERDGPGRLHDAIERIEGIAIPWSTLVQDVLPARVDAFEIRMLDDLSARGEIVWVGAGPLGARDGRIRIFKLESARRLLAAEDESSSDDATRELTEQAIHRVILEQLRERGASFTHALEQAVRDACDDTDAKEFESALWDLVWHGLVRNDTFGPFASLVRSRGRRRRGQVLAGGRWSLVSEIYDPRVSETERAHARAGTFLERYGVVSRDALKTETVRGGFSSVYPVLRAMEDSGQVRRGWFVEGLLGAQFALPGAVDRLRSVRETRGEIKRVCLAVLDPANPWGALIAWPPTRDLEHKARRVAGAHVILIDGAPVLWIAPKRKHIISFADVDDEAIRAAIQCLVELQSPKRPRTIERIDGVEAPRHELCAQFCEHGYVEDYRGLFYEGRASYPDA